MSDKIAAQEKSEEAELFGPGLVLRELHGRLFGKRKQRVDAGGLSGFFKRFDDAGKEQSTINAVLFGAVESSVRKAEMTDEGAQLVVEHARENDTGKGATVEDNTFRRAGAVIFDGFQQEFEIERRVMGDKRQVAAEFRQFRENRLDAGFPGNHFVGDSVDRRSFRRYAPSGVNERAEGSNRFGVTEAHRADFDDGVGFRLNSGSFQIERYKVHAVSYTVNTGTAQGWR